MAAENEHDGTTTAPISRHPAALADDRRGGRSHRQLGTIALADSATEADGLAAFDPDHRATGVLAGWTIAITWLAIVATVTRLTKWLPQQPSAD